MVTSLFWVHSERLMGLIALRLAVLVVVGMTVFGWGARAQAQTLEIITNNGSNSVNMTMKELTELPLTEFTTSTVWTKGVDRYTGVLLRDLLGHLDIDISANSGTVTFDAVDGYSASISFPTIRSAEPLLAFHRNDRPMSIRSQGPFWLIFNYDADARFRTETLYALSVWQIERLTVE